MSEMPTLGSEYDFELFVSTPYGEESYEMRVTYNHYPQIKWGLEVEPCAEYYEVESIVPILRGYESDLRRRNALALAIQAIEMHFENPDQLHSVLGDL